MDEGADDPHLEGRTWSTLTLRSSLGEGDTRLLFASRVLADAVAPDAKILAMKTTDTERAGLELPGGVIVPAATLHEVFASVTLERELRTGRQDAMRRFDETAIDWEVSTPWIDLAMSRFTRGAGVSEGLAVNNARRQFAVHMTHDVDRTTFFEPFTLAKSTALALRIGSAGKPGLRTSLTPRALLRAVERLLDFERQMGVRACFFMMSEPFGLGRHASRTSPHWASWRTYARLVREAEMDIGLHGSYEARDRDSYGEERERLEQAIGRPVIAHRNHYLRFDTTGICSQMHRAGIKYEYSFGYSSRVGFRTGCARVHRTFDLTNETEAGLLAVPLLFMDSNLGADMAQTMRRLEAALGHVRDVGGTVSLLFHPELLAADSGAWPWFEHTVQICREMGADLSGGLLSERPAV
jgi:hypothetical protein